jgi:hypothetical protein
MGLRRGGDFFTDAPGKLADRSAEQSRLDAAPQPLEH